MEIQRIIASVDADYEAFAAECDAKRKEHGEWLAETMPTAAIRAPSIGAVQAPSRAAHTAVLRPSRLFLDGGSE